MSNAYEPPSRLSISMVYGEDFHDSGDRLIKRLCTDDYVLIGHLDGNPDRVHISKVIERVLLGSLTFTFPATVDSESGRSLDLSDDRVFPNYDSLWFYSSKRELPPLPDVFVFNAAESPWPIRGEDGIAELQAVTSWMVENRVWGCVIDGFQGLAIEIAL